MNQNKSKGYFVLVKHVPAPTHNFESLNEGDLRSIRMG